MFVFLSAIFKAKINITASYVPCQYSTCDLCDLYIGYLVLASIRIDSESKRNTTKGEGVVMKCQLTGDGDVRDDRNTSHFVQMLRI